MKRRVIITTTTEIDDEKAWREYQHRVLEAFGDTIGMRIITALNAKGASKIESGRSVTVHRLINVADETCSRPECNSPRWREGDHLCSAHAQEAQAAANEKRR